MISETVPICKEILSPNSVCEEQVISKGLRCNVASNARKKGLYEFNYTEYGAVVPRSTKYRDLGVIFYSTLQFVPHLQFQYPGSLKAPGFVHK